MMLFMLAFVAVCCSEEEPLTNPVKKGGEVQFGLSLERLSRTVYGDEANNAFPIYWVNGDKVQIFSPQCLDGRRNAEYQVAVTSETQNFADNLTKTGAYGIQWGNVDKAIFYSLYPSGSYSLSEDGTKAQNITINYSQSIIVDGESVKSDMEDCLMYAKNDGGQDNDFQGVPNGETVNLQYNPISTVFWIKLNVPSTSADDFIIQSVSLEAPAGTNIAGTFSLNIEDGTFGEWGESKSNVVSAQIYDKATGGFYTLTKGNSVEIPLFLAPVTGLNTDGWKIKVVANQMEKVKTLTSQDIVAGKIHKVTLPNLSTSAAATEWDVATWMKYIPRNVYLSEVSIPGSWNSLNSQFQGSSPNVDTQYTNGVRAFHIDTRWKSSRNPLLGSNLADPGTLSLAVANGTTAYNYDSKKLMNKDAPLFTTILSQITSKIESNLEEYMVVICSFAQESYEGEKCPSTWIEAISNACESDANVLDAKSINENTLVGDVLGKVLVIVNLPNEITNTTQLPENSKCLFTYLPSALSSEHFDGTDDNNDNLWYYKSGSTTDDSGVTINTYADQTGISIYNNQAQITSNGTNGISTRERGYAPTTTERTAVLNKIVNWSKSNYGTDNYQHNVWAYLGLGGYLVSNTEASEVKDSHKTIASTYNPWINGKVTEMGTTPEGQTSVIPYYPVGIVLMNYVNDYASIVKNILLLNNKYRLQYDPSKPSDYDPNYKDPGDNDASGGEGGDIIL